VDDDALVALLHQVVDAVHTVLGDLGDWGPAGTRPGQYLSDVAADAAALDVLLAAGVGVLSEESGLHHADRPLLVIVDPVDGSTNADRRLPWYATSLCTLDEHGPRAAVVANQASGTRYEATRGGGARRDGRSIQASGCQELGQAMVGVSSLPPAHLGWSQFRALGAAALDLCAVADGTLDAYLDCGRDAHGPWDYLGGLLVCHEAGAVTADVLGRSLIVRGRHDRRSPAAAATPQLLAALLAGAHGAAAPVSGDDKPVSST